VKKKRFSEEQMIGVLKEGAAGANVSELCRKHGISEATYYNWKAKYASMSVTELRRLKELEGENSKLKHFWLKSLIPCCSRSGRELSRRGRMQGTDARRNLGAQFALGHSHVVLGLKVEPKARLHTEEQAQPERGVRGDRPLAVDQFADAAG